MSSGQHTKWVRVTHWLGTISFLLLVFSGVEILMVHPRLYWGEVGNDLTSCLFELPISRNYKHGGWIGEGRTYDIFNQNGWGRSLHFLNAWVLVGVGVVYLLLAFYTRHVQRNLVPWVSFKAGPNYGVLQKLAYCIVLFWLVPTIVMTGLAMSPAITASHPWLLVIFFGAQSARTIHFFCSGLLVLFLIVHIVKVIQSGFGKQMRAMTIEKRS